MFDMLLNARRKFHGAFVEVGIDPIAVSIYSKLLHVYDMQIDDDDFTLDLRSALNLTNTHVVHGSAIALATALPENNSYESNNARSVGMGSPSLIGHVDVACSFWARRTADFIDGSGFVVGHRYIGEDSPSNSQFEIMCRADGRFSFGWERSAGTNHNVSTVATPWLQDETHFGVASRDAINKQISFYIDGALVESAKSYVYGPTGGGSAKIQIGSYNAGEANFEGLLAGVWIYSQQLSAVEVSWLYNGGAGRNYGELLTLAGI